MGQANKKETIVQTEVCLYDQNRIIIPQEEYFNEFRKLDNSERIEFFLQTPSIDVNRQLQLAVNNDAIDLAIFFIEQDANVIGNIDLDSGLPILFLSKSAEMIDLLLSNDTTYTSLDVTQIKLSMQDSTENSSNKYFRKNPIIFQHLANSVIFQEMLEFKKQKFVKEIFGLMFIGSNLPACRIIIDSFPEYDLTSITAKGMSICLKRQIMLADNTLWLLLGLNFDLFTPNEFENTALSCALNYEIALDTYKQILQHAILTNRNQFNIFLMKNPEFVYKIRATIKTPFLFAERDKELEQRLYEYIDNKFIPITHYEFKSLSGYKVELKHNQENLTPEPEKDSNYKQQTICVSLATLYAFNRHYAEHSKYHFITMQVEKTYKHIYRLLKDIKAEIIKHPEQYATPEYSLLLDLLDIKYSKNAYKHTLLFRPANDRIIPTEYQDLTFKFSQE